MLSIVVEIYGEAFNSKLYPNCTPPIQLPDTTYPVAAQDDWIGGVQFHMGYVGVGQDRGKYFFTAL